MSFLLGGAKTSQATQAPQISGMQVQTSAYGKVIPIAVGQIRVSPNLLWYGDFLAVKHRQAGGGKGGIAGGGGGKGGGGGYTYTYSTSIMFGLCEGPIGNILEVYKDKAKISPATLGMSTALGTYPQTPWDYLTTNHGYIFVTTVIPGTPYQYTTEFHDPFLVDNGVTTNITLTNTSPYNTVGVSEYQVTRVNSKFVYTFNAARAGIDVTFTGRQDKTEIQTIPATAPYQISLDDNWNTLKILNLDFTKVVGAPALNQYSLNTTTGVYTFNSANAGDTVTISYSAGDQDPVFEAIGYNGVAWAAAANYDLGNSPSLSNHSFLLQALFSNDIGSISEPGTPVTSSVASGALNATHYFVQTTWVNANGETLPSVETIQICTASHVVKVTAPTAPPTGATGWNVYISNTSGGGSGHETKQNITTNTLAIDWTLPDTGLIEGDGVPTINTTGITDADPSLFINEVMTNEKFGMGFPAAFLDDLSTYQDYVLASGLLVSFVLDSQNQASTILDGLATATNSEWVWLDGKLTLVPYGDESITANGHTYTPPGAPLYNLTDDDFMPQSDGDPVQRYRRRPQDVTNWVQMEFRDRARDYNVDVVEWKNSALIDLYKLRPQPQTGVSFQFFADKSIAQQSIQLYGQRQLVVNSYKFKLDQRYIVLDPMDIVTITNSRIGVSLLPVRIKRITENADNTLTFEAEDYLAGIGATATYSFQSGTGYSVNYNDTPGSVNTPIIFEAPVQIATNTGLETWILASGGDNWGGCYVYVSANGNTFGPIQGKIQGQGRTGVVVSDSGTVLQVDLTESKSSLISGTSTDATQANTLCYVNGELLSYTTATLVSPYVYDLGGLNRGLYQTDYVIHLAGEKFGRLDQQVITVPYDKTQIEQTIFVKLCSFNIFGGGQQGLADVSAFSHTVEGPPIPPDVIDFNVQDPGNGSVVFAWDDVVDFAVKGFDISYGPQGGTFGGSIFLTEAERGTEMTNASVPPGCWTFYIVAVDIADQQSAIPGTFDLCIANANAVITTTEYDPDFINAAPGSGLFPTSYYKHYTGVLIPNGTLLASAYDLLSPPAAPVLSSITGGALGSRVYYVVITYTTASGETMVSSESSITVSAGSLLVVDSPPDTGSPEGYNIYISTATTTETKQNSTAILLGASWTEPTTGLISGAAQPATNTTGWEVFDRFVPDPVLLQTFTGAEIDTGNTTSKRIWMSYTAELGPGETQFTNIVTDLSVASISGGPYTTNAWIIGNDAHQYIYPSIVGESGVTGGTTYGVAYIEAFQITVDAAITTKSATGVSIGAGGTTILFSDYPTLNATYNIIPSVTPTVTSGTGISATALNVTKTGAEIHIYDSTGAGVTGTVSLQVTGP